MLLAVISSCNIASNSRTGRESVNSRNNSAVFPEISVKKPSGKGKWGSNWGDLGECLVKFPDPGENHGMDKKRPFYRISTFWNNISILWEICLPIASVRVSFKAFIYRILGK